MGESQKQVMLLAKRCITASLKRNEVPKGALLIELTVSGEGAVSGVSLGGDFPKSTRACLDKGLREITFPGNGTTRFFKYPINSDASESD